jgi:hypothetical protein
MYYFIESMHRFAEEQPVTDRELRREFEWQRREILKQFVGKVVRKIVFRLTHEENASTEMAALQEACSVMIRTPPKYFEFPFSQECADFVKICRNLCVLHGFDDILRNLDSYFPDRQY